MDDSAYAVSYSTQEGEIKVAHKKGEWFRIYLDNNRVLAYKKGRLHIIEDNLDLFISKIDK